MAPSLEKPAEDEIEVSLFGPGYGESVVLHVGRDEWVIIDSCTHSSHGNPVPLHYLQSLGVDATQRVVLVVASHWHDDHIRGLSTIVDICRNASFSCSPAFRSDQFGILYRLYSRKRLGISSGVDEFGKIFETIARRRSTALLASACSRLFLRSRSGNGHPFDVELWALSPTNATVAAYVQQLSVLIGRRNAGACVPDFNPNHVAVVTQLLAGTDSVLLGNDLENSGTFGWSFVLADGTRPQTRSSAFKVSHHGGASGHDAAMWTTMLDSQAYAFIAPNGRGSRLPTTTDINRIKNLTRKAYITADSSLRGTRRSLPRDVVRTLRENEVRMEPIPTTAGHIRYRFKPGFPASRRVDLFNGAQIL